MIVELNEAEQRLAKYIAARRSASNRAANVKDQKVGPQDAASTDLEGAGSEIAFCKLMNVYPDLSLDHHPDEDGFVYPGGRVDVKSTKYANGRLLAITGKKTKPADLYALMVGAFPKYRCAGLIAARDVFVESNIKDLGHGPTYAVEQARLTPVAQWVADYEKNNE